MRTLESVSALALVVAAGPALGQAVNVNEPPAGTVQTQGNIPIIDSSTNQGTATIYSSANLNTTLNVSSGGTLILSTPTSGSNSYSGGTYVNGGSTLSFGADSQLGSGGNITLGSTSGSGSSTVNTSGTLEWTSTSTITSSHNFVLSGTGNVLQGTTGPGNLIIGGSITSTSSTVPSPTDNPLLIIQGQGTVVDLSGANTFYGNVKVTDGATLAINGDSVLGATYVTTTSLNGLTTTTATPIANVLTLDNGTLQFTSTMDIYHALDITANGGTLDTGGNAVTIDVQTSNGAQANVGINDQGALNKIGGGALILENPANIVAGGTTISSGSGTVGALQVGDTVNSPVKLYSNVTVLTGGALTGFGTVVGNVSNYGGFVAPGGSGAASSSVVATLTIQGNYLQTNGGETYAAITPLGVANTVVTGGATVAGTLDIGYGNGFLHPGVYQVFSANTMNGTAFSTISATVPSIGLVQTVTPTSTGVTVTLTQVKSLPAYATVVPAMTTEGIEESQAWTGDILNHMLDVRQNAYADNMSVATSEYHRTRTVSPYGVWFAPIGDSGTVSSNNGAPGLTTSQGGFLMGVDDELLRGVSGGIAVGFERSNVAEKGVNASNGRIETPHLDFYTSYWRGPFALDATAGIAVSGVKTDRPVEEAQGSYGTTQMSTGLQASYATRLDGWAVTGAVGSKFVHFVQSEFTETGPTYANFFVDHRFTNSLRPFVDATLSRRFEIGNVSALVPQVRVGYEQEMMSGLRMVNTMTEGDDFNWLVRGITPGKGSLTASASVVLETSKTQSYYMTYDRYQSSTTTDQTVSAGLRFRM